MQQGGNHLAEFLRSRRALVAPERAGVPQAGQRRVPGLRREEVAMLAGVSVDYYIRLEQGRERHPSAAVVDALARALELDDDAAAHLAGLASPAASRTRRPRRRPERVTPELAAMLDGLAGHPATVLDRRLTVIAANPLAVAVFGHRPGANLVRAAFLDPESRERYPEWERVAAATVAALRAATGTDLDDPDLVALVGECSLHSADFRRLWARADVRVKGNETKRYLHPSVGELTLNVSTFTVNGSDGQQLVIYRAEPGSRSAESLALLAGLTEAGEPRVRAGTRAR
jgi:transcriptional regulator with XRE-family HTH domain